MASAIEPVTRAADSRETGWVNRLFTSEGSTPEYQELKFTLHRKLLDRINLEALSSMSGNVSARRFAPPLPDSLTTRRRPSAWWRKTG